MRVLVVGAGGLGSPCALALAEAGVETIGIVDDDVVDLSNLHRQLLHTDADLGRAKVESARDKLSAFGIEVRPYRARFDARLAQDLLPQFDIIVDGSDNFETKFLVNDVCVAAQKPFVIGAAVRWSGQLLCWLPGEACYRCLFEAPPPPDCTQSCQEAGVMGPVCGVIGGLQAAAALALGGQPIPGYAPRPGCIYLYDALAGELRGVALRPNRECTACAEGKLEECAS